MDEQRYENERVAALTGAAGLNRRRFIGITGRLAAALPFGRLLMGRTRRPLALPTSGNAFSASMMTKQMVGRLSAEPPFSFTYGGRRSSVLLARWSRRVTSRALDASRTEHTITWTEPHAGLVVRCVAVEYHDIPTIEWTLYIKNSGAKALPPVGEILVIDTGFSRTAGKEFTLHTCDGSLAVIQDFGLHTVQLSPHAHILLTCQGGRPTCGLVRADPHLLQGGFPYYNVDWGGQGVIVALGWPGQWAAELTRDDARGLRVQGGMSTRDGINLPARTHIHDMALAEIALRPGEEIRTPLIVVQFWQGVDWIAGQNNWRRWMSAHNMPHPGGRPPAPMCPAQTGSVSLTTDAAAELTSVQEYGANHLTATSGGVYDHWWIDAGWYQVPPEATDWSWTGTWEADPKRYPHGLRSVTDAARARGMKSIIWHEPERVRPDTWLYKQHPEWLLGPGPDGDNRLLDLGNPDAWRWVVEHFDGLIRANGVDVYRQDFNIDPLTYWNVGDSPGRRGITQIRHVTGFLAFWDELRRRHPGLLIDTCASGGRRLDLETLRRSVPLWRSDDQGDATTEQCHSYGLALWCPYHGTGIGTDSVYLLRSGMTPSYLVFFNPDTALNATQALVQRMTREWRSFADDLLGDYYPLLPYTINLDVWNAWQFNRPETGTGVVQVFRRDYSTVPAMRLPLRGLDATATYVARNADDKGSLRLSGHQLMTTGLSVHLPTAPAAATITYRRVTPP